MSIVASVVSVAVAFGIAAAADTVMPSDAIQRTAGSPTSVAAPSSAISPRPVVSSTATQSRATVQTFADERFVADLAYRRDPAASMAIDREPIEEVLAVALATIDRLLPGPPVRIRIDGEPDRLPEDARAALEDVGIIARSGPASIEVFLHPTPLIPMDTLIAEVLPGVLAHEVHHTVRSHALLGERGQIPTLGELIVGEGAADAFALQAFPGFETTMLAQLPERSARLRPLPVDEQRRVWAIAEPALDAVLSPSQAARWVFGDGDLPDRAAYRLGHAVVRAYLAANPSESPADLATVSASDVIEDSGFEPSSVDHRGTGPDGAFGRPSGAHRLTCGSGVSPEASPAMAITLDITSGLASFPGPGRRPLSCLGRARRGTSGALYLQSAPAGLNPFPRSALRGSQRGERR